MYEQYVPDEGIVQTFLRYDNRINRKRYIKRTLALVGIDFIIAFIFAVIMAIIDIDENVTESILEWIAITVMSPNIFLTMRRFHDLDKPGWWALTTIIPIVNVIMELYLIFAKGTQGQNQFGPDPLEE